MAVDTREKQSLRYVADEGAPRYLTSYIARRAYKEAVQRPPHVYGVTDVIDIHCHAHDGQQDPLELAKYASANGMGGLLYKSIVGRARPAESVRKVLEALKPWCEEQGVEPIRAWAGFNIGHGSSLATPEAVREQLDDGVVCIWMPTAKHANTISKIGGPPMWWDKDADPNAHTGPMPFEDAVTKGHYLLDEHGRLKEGVREIFRMVADRNLAISFAHATHREQDAMAEEVSRLGIKKAFVDHPFSPFVDLTLDRMRELTRSGIYMNFTFDEISPLLGVDPQRMYNTIRALGTDYVTLSSDCGEPLFPNSVEGMRLLCGYMRAFGLSEDEVRQVSVLNPRKIVGWE
jgi:Family of unknown function (DUF6282)